MKGRNTAMELAHTMIAPIATHSSKRMTLIFKTEQSHNQNKT
jgi:hypothetical protein